MDSQVSSDAAPPTLGAATGAAMEPGSTPATPRESPATPHETPAAPHETPAAPHGAPAELEGVRLDTDA
ncbi:hypothetical protein GCM10009827_093300 [Dactylosporangium maewongense]|uniref:Uncharacterized protein n=1 Tax=Dactylosporangium maewongense TaxID=634393 RepID=A0ABN2CEV6_9ACTN